MPRQQEYNEKMARKKAARMKKIKGILKQQDKAREEKQGYRPNTEQQMFEGVKRKLGGGNPFEFLKR